MKPTALLVNTSRAGLLDIDAAVHAVAEARLGGLGLDVFDQEPLPADDPLRATVGVLTTPHLGYVADDVYALFFSQVVEDIAAFAEGEPVRVLADRAGPGSPYAGRVAATDTYRELGEAAWSWVLGQVRGDDGPWLPETVPEDDATRGPVRGPGLVLHRHRRPGAGAGRDRPAPGADRRGAGARARDRRAALDDRRPSAPSPPCTTGWPATSWRSGCSTRAARRSRSSGSWS